MVRGAIIFICLTVLGVAETVEVSANHIVSDQLKGQTIMRGNVVIQKQGDILYANEVIVKTDRNKKPSNYQAKGNVRFRVKTNDGRIMQGNANQIIYDAIQEEYRLIGKAYVQEQGKKNSIKGEVIVLNRKSGSASVEGDKKKPAKIIFTLEQNKDRS